VRRRCLNNTELRAGIPTTTTTTQVAPGFSRSSSCANGGVWRGGLYLARGTLTRIFAFGCPSVPTGGFVRDKVRSSSRAVLLLQCQAIASSANVV